MVEENRGARDAGGPPPWRPGRFAVWSRRWTDPNDAQPTTVLLQHPVDPFVVALENANDASLQSAAFAYLDAALKLESIEPRLQLPQSWIDALRPAASSDTFGWMPVQWPVRGDARQFNEPFGSFRVGPAANDHLVALFASGRIGKTQFLGSGFGLRIVLRLRALQAGFEASITGLSACLPFGVYRTSSVGNDTWSEQERTNEFVGFLISAQVKAQIAKASGLDASTVRIRGVRLAKLPQGVFQVERRGVGVLAPPDEYSLGTPYSFTFLGTDKSAGTLLHRSPLVADAVAGNARVLVRDPASHGAAATLRERRPTRDEEALDYCRRDEAITGALDGPLEDGSQLKVVPCPRFVRADQGKGPKTPREVHLPGTGPAVRRNDASAVQGFRHARELLRRLAAYGLPPDDYFRIAKAEIDVAYRSGISPGPGKDGQTVNARVLPEGWPVDFIGPTPIGQRPVLQLHLGLANLARRARAPWHTGGERSPAEPLGIGADARWMWHEFGHLLLMATTGELELRFAHSPGDALAAIVADPESKLRPHTLWRFATFPWVFLPRRHDRCVLHGWSWGGAMHAELARVPDAKQPRRKGYQSEQILSSSLFRLYRCLGGDTVRDTGLNDAGRFERQRASHYTVYLVMKALQLLGDARLVQARTPEELVFALMLADITTGAWSATFPAGTGPTYLRTGGCAHKAIRWAFEAQGLYVEQNAAGNAPGGPPPVDVYIASRRPEVDKTPYGDVAYGPGNYLPVSLHWQADKSSSVPAWQAADNAIRVRSDGKIDVEVGNRGKQLARGVEVSVWWAAWPANSAPPVWPDATSWTAGTPSASPPQDIAPGALATFGPFDVTPPAGRYVVFAQANCLEDRANTDPATKLACTTHATPIIDIVANDNNVGLRVVG